MASKTQELISHLMKYSIARSNRFQVIIPFPEALNRSPLTQGPSSFTASALELLRAYAGASGATRGLELMVEMTEMPGKQMSTSDVKYNGDVLKMPYSVIYNALPFTFNVSRDMYEKKILDKWMNLVVNPKTHEAGYYADYTTDIIISQLDERDRPVHTVVCKECYPYSTNPLTMSQSETNQGHKLMVVFMYKRWEDQEDPTYDRGVGSLSQTPLGPFVTPILANPVVQRALQIFEDNTGIDLEGEAVNVYNQVNEIVLNTTGTSINKAVSLLEAIRASTAVNGNITPDQMARILEIIDRTINIMKP